MIKSANLQMGKVTLALPRCFGRSKACEKCGERLTDQEIRLEHAWCAECTHQAKRPCCCVVG